PGFFRGVMWLSRLEFNLVSRSSRSSQPGETPDPSETPREAMDALALVDLIGRSGEMQGVIQLDHSWAVLAGKREDVSPENLSTLMRVKSIAVGRAESFQKLKDAIGAGYVRTIRMHYMPQGSDHLPVIFTLLGPRAVADAQSLMPIVHPSVNSRTMISSVDAAYILGNDRAATYLTQDLLRFSTLRAKLDEARRNLNLDGLDLYSLWMSAIRSLSATSPSSPSYMKSEAFADMRLNSTVAAFAQIKHNYVLLASQGYDEGGCTIPYGFVEPAVETYAALERYAIRGRLAMVELKAGPEAVSYFQRTEKILSALARISRWEREGRSLPPEALRFLSMITEMSPGGTGGPPTYTGWYFDLFYDRNDALRSPALIADFYTSVNEQKVAYAGVSGARLGVFLVETGGERRVVVGPVAVAFSTSGGLDKRYTDDDVPSVSRYAPWSGSYTVAAPPVPPLSVDYTVDSDSSFHVMLQTDIPELTIELLDHNRRPIASRVFKHPPRDLSFKIPVPAGKEVRAIHISAGDFHTWGEVSWVGYSFRASTFVEKEP
ncbi:MAG TPA: DUF3160 domain-containing protein, partial [Leptospiraceae bacterium]|nr:DUF3160 domain-containing protein [Leptospiraceae bacterium]